MQKVISTRLYYLLSIVISILYAYSLFPLDFFTGTNPFWFDVSTDPTQHVTGSWAFFADSWGFPLLHTTYLNYPEGVSTAYADIIPLAALIFKPVVGLFPAGTHYFGVWVLLSYLLQGIAGAYFLGNAKGKTPLFALTGTLFALMMPSLLIRIPHSALLMQSLLIFSLAFYYLAMTGKLSAHSATRRQAGLILIATLVHPYFIAMLYPLYLVTHLSLVLKHKEKPFYALTEIVLLTFAVLLSLWIVGYLIPSEGAFRSSYGFDISSMNLLSPFLGTHLAGSFFLPSERFVLDATGMQIDGHNYLGIVLLMMLGWALLFRSRKLVEIVTRHWVMVLLMIGFVIYSLSTKIYFSDTLVLSYSLPEIFDKITGTFRSSGRFFWPVGYAILFGLLFLVIDNCRSRYLTLCLSAMILLQYIDMAPHRAYLYESSHRKTNFGVKHDVWSDLVGSSSHIYLFPTYGCGAFHTDAMIWQYFATAQKKHYNTGFVARVQTDCKSKRDILKKPKVTGDLFVFTKDKVSSQEVSESMGEAFYQQCRYHAVGIVCKIGATDEDWQHFSDGNFSKIKDR